MYKKYRTCVFRIYPKKIEKEKIINNMKCANKVYNIILNYERKTCKEYKAYMLECQKNNITPNFKCIENINKIPKLAQIKNMDKYKYLKEADHIALDSARMNLQYGYKMLFKGYNNHRPKLKSVKKSNKYTTRCINDNVRFGKNSIRLPKIGFVKCKIHRNINEMGIIVKVTIKTTDFKKYFACVTFMKIENEPENIKVDNSKIIGIDFNIKNVYVDNNFNKGRHINKVEILQSKAERMYKKLKGKLYGSNRWNKEVSKIRCKYEKIVNIRKNNVYDMCKNMIINNDYIGVETISIKEISKEVFDRNKLYDCSFKKIIKILDYKLQENGGKLVKVSKWFKSSKICNNCGYIKEDLEISDRVYNCDNCKIILDRDLNAAINIKNETIRILRA